MPTPTFRPVFRSAPLSSSTPVPVETPIPTLAPTAPPTPTPTPIPVLTEAPTPGTEVDPYTYLYTHLLRPRPRYDAEAGPDTHRYAYTRPYRGPHFNTDPDVDSFPDAHPIAHSRPFRNSHSHPESNAEPNPYSVSISHTTGVGRGVKIACIFFDGVVPRSESDEYVQISNAGQAPQEMLGWLLRDRDDERQEFVFPAWTLNPGDVVRVYTNEVHPQWGGFSFGEARRSGTTRTRTGQTCTMRRVCWSPARPILRLLISNLQSPLALLAPPVAIAGGKPSAGSLVVTGLGDLSTVLLETGYFEERLYLCDIVRTHSRDMPLGKEWFALDRITGSHQCAEALGNIAVWLVLLLIALALIQNLLGSATTTDFRLAGRYESERAATLLEEKLRGPEKACRDSHRAVTVPLRWTTRLSAPRWKRSTRISSRWAWDDIRRDKRPAAVPLLPCH